MRFGFFFFCRNGMPVSLHMLTGFFRSASSSFFLAPPISDTEMFIRVTDHQRRRFVCLYLLNRPRLKLFVTADHGIFVVTAEGKNRVFTSQKMQLDTCLFHFRFT
jgi:hypothetical protein